MSASRSTPDQLQARALAKGRLEAMRRRARRIRRTVASLAVALFATAFLIVYVQLASGHDPALVANAAKRRAASTSVTKTDAAESATSASDAAEASTTTEPSAGSESSSGSEDSTATESSTASGSTSGSEESSSGASAVTTSQS
jgi:type IV secretory pathway TrbL component